MAKTKMIKNAKNTMIDKPVKQKKVKKFYEFLENVYHNHTMYKKGAKYGLSAKEANALKNYIKQLKEI